MGIETLLSIGSIYFFIVIGFSAKKFLKEKIDEKSLVLLSLYFLQPILAFWGLTKAHISLEFLGVPLYYLLIVFISLFFMILVNRFLFEDTKERTIYLAISLVGNTGNLGIPLGIALFGEQSIPYTSIINIANVFFIYIFSVYFFARDKFSFKEAIKSIFKIPVIWFALFAIVYNIAELPINNAFKLVLQMGAYSAIVIQLIIFGMFISQTKIKSSSWRLPLHISFVKHIFFPFVGFVFLLFVKVDPLISAILLLEIAVPLAVNNVNISSLYNCRPYEVTKAVLLSSVLFVFFIFVYYEVIDYYFLQGI